VPILIALIIRRKGEFFKKDIWQFLLGIAPFLIINFLYNYFITGNFLLSPFNWSDPDDTIGLKLSLFLDNIDSLENQFLWMNPVLLAAYFFAVIVLALKKNAHSYELFFLLLITCCFFYGAPGVSYGSRYYFEGYLLCVLTIIGRMAQFKDAPVKGHISLVIIVGFLASLVLIPGYAWHYSHKLYYENELYRLVGEKHLSNAVVFMPPEKLFTNREPRNDPDFRNDVIYAHDLKAKNALILKYFPTRNFYIYMPEVKNEGQRIQKYKFPDLIQT
jgi:hypothetical protein